MGSWYMNLSDYMGGGCLWKFNSMGGGGGIKVPSSPSRYFFWNSPESKYPSIVFLSIFQRSHM